MEYENKFRKVASLLGDKSRSVMLWNLLDGRASNFLFSPTAVFSHYAGNKSIHQAIIDSYCFRRKGRNKAIQP